jgi:hypothetical protein
VELRRVRSNEWLAAGFGVLLVASLFLDWYTGETGWESFAVTDVILAIAGLLGVALWIGTATQRTPAVQQSVAALTCPVALLGSILAVVHLFTVPGDGGREAGVWVGVVAVLGLLVSAWRSMGDQSFPATVTPQPDVAVLPTPAAGRADSARDE